jgi:hypothetical protein
MPAIRSRREHAGPAREMLSLQRLLTCEMFLDGVPMVGFAAEGEGDMGESIGAGARAACMRSVERGELLGEGAARAAGINAEESTQLHTQAFDGQVGGMATVPAVDASGASVAQRTARGTAASRDVENQLAIAKVRSIYMQLGEMEKRAVRCMAPTPGEKGKYRSRLYT